MDFVRQDVDKHERSMEEKNVAEVEVEARSESSTDSPDLRFVSGRGKLALVARRLRTLGVEARGV
jgi:hypothetical protein